MSNPVLDCSALLAFLLREPGAEQVEAILPAAVMSAVNFTEALTKLVERGIPPANARDVILGLGIEIIDFDTDQAVRAAALREPTRKAGLSLGDRACLALALQRQAPAFTSDKAWLRLSDADMPPIICIRGVSS
ncbi:type II toxin-antitoxin system VapC family toxin [Niveispirillum irakense]|uniref:type II toxin-antitoxin system VapC family toxin n=1 Tax=Niveispirillum irakense TaxID=34011 RepID=UPI0005501AD0|nr:type II toxin-antitoxin system VapC family toxin [Niveispirillum irakense]